jgi:hypothetical protein
MEASSVAWIMYNCTSFREAYRSMYPSAVSDQHLFFVLLPPVIGFFSAFCHTVCQYPLNCFIAVYQCPSLYLQYCHAVCQWILPPLICCLSVSIPLLLFMLPVPVSTSVHRIVLFLVCLPVYVPYFLVLLLSVSWGNNVTKQRIKFLEITVQYLHVEGRKNSQPHGACLHSYFFFISSFYTVLFQISL